MEPYVECACRSVSGLAIIQMLRSIYQNFNLFSVDFWIFFLFVSWYIKYKTTHGYICIITRIALIDLSHNYIPFLNSTTHTINAVICSMCRFVFRSVRLSRLDNDSIKLNTNTCPAVDIRIWEMVVVWLHRQYVCHARNEYKHS